MYNVNRPMDQKARILSKEMASYFHPWGGGCIGSVLSFCP